MQRTDLLHTLNCELINRPIEMPANYQQPAATTFQRSVVNCVTHQHQMSIRNFPLD